MTKIKTVHEMLDERDAELGALRAQLAQRDAQIAVLRERFRKLAKVHHELSHTETTAPYEVCQAPTCVEYRKMVSECAAAAEAHDAAVRVAERERCAQIAYQWVSDPTHQRGSGGMAWETAEAIRATALRPKEE